MFSLDASQWRVIRFTAASAFGFWLFSQNRLKPHSLPVAG